LYKETGVRRQIQLAQEEQEGDNQNTIPNPQSLRVRGNKAKETVKAGGGLLNLIILLQVY